MSAPLLIHYFDFLVKLAPPVDLGQTARGYRVVFYIRRPNEVGLQIDAVEQ
jgi:hypothetical protein